MPGQGADLFSIDLWIDGAIVLVCVLFSAFFSGSETALTAASKVRMFALARNGDKRAEAVNRLIASRSRLIGAMLLGNTLVNISASAFATSVLVGLFGDRGVIYATVSMTVLLLVFAEDRRHQLPRPHVARLGAAGRLLRRDFRPRAHQRRGFCARAVAGVRRAAGRALVHVVGH